MRKLLRHLFILTTSLVCANTVQADSCCWWEGLTVEADYLIWKPEQSGMSYVVAIDEATLAPPAPNSAPIFQQGDWTSGFRIGAGYAMPCSCADLSFTWTRLHHNNVNTAVVPIFIATELLGVVNDLLIGGTSESSYAISQWDLHFDMLDFRIASCHLGGCCCSFDPYIGVKGGWIDQTQTIEYNNLLNTTTSDRVNALVTEYNNFSGAGPTLGFATSFTLYNNLNVFGTVAGSLLWGHSENPTTQYAEMPPGTEFANGTVAFDSYKLMPAAELQIGLDWGTCWCDYSFNIAVAYETQYFWNTWRHQNSYIQNLYVTNAGYSDLMMQGVTLHFSLGF